MSIAEPILLTPGPLTTSARTRQAMMVDWGSWDDRFNQLTASLCEQLLAILNGAATHHCVPLQGSGTFAVEAAIGGRHVTDVFEGERRFAAVVRLPERFRDNIESIRNMLVTAPDGARLPLSALWPWSGRLCWC